MRAALLLLLAAFAAAAHTGHPHFNSRTEFKASKKWWPSAGAASIPTDRLMGSYGMRIKTKSHPYLFQSSSTTPLTSTSTSTTTTTTTTAATTTTTTSTTTTTLAPETTTIIELEAEPTQEATTLIEETTLPPTTTTPEPTTAAPTVPVTTPLDNGTLSPFTQNLVQARLLWPDNQIGSCEFELDTTLSTPSSPLFWPKTRVYEVALPNRLCLTAEYAFVTRECKMDIRSKPFWAQPNGTCSDKVGSSATSVLYSSNNEGVSAVNVASITRRMATALGSADDVPSPADVLMVDKLFAQIEYHSSNLGPNNLKDIGNILDSVISSSNANEQDFQKPSLKTATNSILWKVDGIMEKIKLDEKGVAIANTKSTSLMAVDMGKSGIKGAQLSGSQIVPLDENQRPGEAAAKFLISSKNRASFVLLDGNNNLFKSVQPDQKLVSRVLGVSLQGEQSWTQHHEAVVQLKFKRTHDQPVRCAFWDMFKHEWRTDGCTLVGRDGDLDVCECTHLTHFGEIIGVAGEDKMLDVISVVGCSLSLLGLVGIAATAVVFQHWRSRLGNKILLNLAASIGLTMTVFLSIALGAGLTSDASCIALGVLLHYSVLASFCWMLVSASLQFLRFVVVLSSRPPHFLLKGVIVGWILPALPISVLLVISPSNSYPHSAPESGFCYPSGLGLILAVVMPVACAVIANLTVFCIIVYRVSCGRPKNLTINSVTERHVMAMRQLRMSVLLFFLLGLTWIFGLLAMVAPGVDAWRSTFAYLFCTTATLQGLALFLFFIVWEKKTRTMWLTTLPERFAPARSSRPTTTSTAYSDSNSQSAVAARGRADEAAPLRQRGSEMEMRRNFGTQNGSSEQI